MNMKKIELILLVLLGLLIAPLHARETCRWAGEIKPGLKQNWSLGAQAGYMSYFGDLSLYDTDLPNKIRYESKFAGGLILTKNLGKSFGISGQFIYGGFKSDEINQSYFETSILEYNVQGKIDFLKMFYRKHNPRTGLYALAGLGQFIYKTKSHEILEGSYQTSHNDSKKPEFVYFVGGGAEYRINRIIKIAAEISIRQAQNDKLDNIVKNNNPDYYSYFSVGFSWAIGNIMNPFNRSTDKEAYKDLGLTRRR